MATPRKPRKTKTVSAAARKKIATEIQKKAAEAAAGRSVAIPSEVFQQIMQTLGSMPYVQVAGLLQTIQQTAKEGIYDETDPASGGAEST